MARNVLVLNLDRVNRGIGPVNLKPAKGNPRASVVDLEDGKTRKNLKELGDTLVVLGEEKVARTDVVALKNTSAAAGGVFAWQNPTGKRIVVKEVALDVTTQSTGACTLDIGTTATSAATLSDTLLDGISVATTGLFSSTDATDKGTNGSAKGRTLAADKWVTASQASGAVAGLVGNALITYVVAA